MKVNRNENVLTKGQSMENVKHSNVINFFWYDNLNTNRKNKKNAAAVNRKSENEISTDGACVSLDVPVYNVYDVTCCTSNGHKGPK